ncbi:hypothetical protein [Novosphingobium sp.]|uniref:hypothetical protein n=1 Tax=Novosphingobium sp. TaxID=1874826 RepID=UPI0035AFD4DA
MIPGPLVAASLGIAACISVGFVQSLKPVSAGAYLFWSSWLVLPYLGLGAAMFLARRKARSSSMVQGTAMIVSIAGPLLLADAVFWHPDAQGGIAVLMVPFVQAGLAAILLPVAWLVTRTRRG